MKKEWTFFLLKPDADRRKLVKPIEKIIEEYFIILKKGSLFLVENDINLLYNKFTFSEYPKKYSSHLKENFISYLMSGICYYYEVESDEACKQIYKYAKKIQGSDYFPERCEPGSIRFDFRDKKKEIHIIEHIKGFGDIPDNIVENLIHTPKDIAERDLQAYILNTKL